MCCLNVMVSAQSVTKFKWGKRRRVSGEVKDAQFFEAFTLDGVDYSLYDSVYLLGEGEEDPYIGILIDFWEEGGGLKKVKVLWLFHPDEILQFIGSEDTVDNELFIACGEGVGLVNINPLEAISGKCDVVFKLNTRKIKPQSGKNPGQYVVYRAFDVGRCIVVSEIGDKIAGINVEVLLNRIGSKDTWAVQKLATTVENMKVVSNDGDDYTKKALREDADDVCISAPDITIPLSTENSSFEGRSASNTTIHVDERSIENQSVSVQNMFKGNKTRLIHGKPDLVLHDKTAYEAKRELCEDTNTGPRKRKKHDGSGVLDAKSANTSYDDLSTMQATLSGETVETNRDKNNEGDNGSVDPFLIERDKNVDESRGLTGTAKETMVADIVNRIVDDRFFKRSSKQDLEKRSDTAQNSPRPNIDRNKWFKLSWDERLRIEHEKGTVVLLCNLDPSFSGIEVEDIIQRSFDVRCTAKMILQPTSYSRPCFGYAFAIFKTRQIAEVVVRKLTEDCLLLPNRRPLVGSFASPYFSGTPSTLCGHFDIDNPRNQLQREMKEALSTSHFSHRSTIEYGMAKEWCDMHERSYQELDSLCKVDLSGVALLGPAIREDKIFVLAHKILHLGNRS